MITAPSIEEPIFTSVFLAGGITNCKNWQKEVIFELETEDITIYNPRRDVFDITDKSSADTQIAWEYERLEKMDIFSIYFCSSTSDQPICMYELGRNIIRMQNRFPCDWKARIVIDVESGYTRAKDVIKQVSLCAPDLLVHPNAAPIIHAARIRRAFHRIIN